MAVVAIPDPSLVVLIGAAGSGKSTFAARHFEPSEILSSDSYRALVAGDAADQRATRAAFGRLHDELRRRLAQRRLTVVDATNVERSARRALLAHSAAAGMPAVAIVLDLSPAVVLARNAARAGRIVPEPVVSRHLASLRSILDGPGDGPGGEPRAGLGDGPGGEPRAGLGDGPGGGPGARLRAEGFDQVVVVGDPLELAAVTIVRERRAHT